MLIIKSRHKSRNFVGKVILEWEQGLIILSQLGVTKKKEFNDIMKKFLIYKKPILGSLVINSNN